MTKLLLENKLKSVCLFLLFAALVPMQMMAQKKVAYINFSKTTMVADASQTGSATVTGNDIIATMLRANGFTVTVYACDANGKDLATNASIETEITGADLIIMQESWGSTSAAIKSTGVLALRKLSAMNIPVIYNKSFAFQKVNTRAITSVTGSTIDLTAASTLSINVVAGKEANPLYKGITLGAGNSVKLFNAGATDLGLLGDPTSTKAISVVMDLEIGTPGTLLATTTGIVASTNAPYTAGNTVTPTSNDTTLLINLIPAGTQVGTDALDKLATKDMFLFAFNYGAIAGGNGSNVTNEFLTLWRNASLILTGQTVPNTLVDKSTLGLTENTLASDSVSVSPNPTSGLVTVNSASSVKAIIVYDATGKQVSSSKTNTVDLSNQAKGIYLVQVQTENGSTTKKVVVE